MLSANNSNNNNETEWCIPILYMILSFNSLSQSLCAFKHFKRIKGFLLDIETNTFKIYKPNVNFINEPNM